MSKSNELDSKKLIESIEYIEKFVKELDELIEVSKAFEKIIEIPNKIGANHIESLISIKNRFWSLSNEMDSIIKKLEKTR